MFSRKKKVFNNILKSVSSILKHITDRIKKTAVIKNPFEHIFPENFYDDLICSLPNLSEYIPIKDTGTVDLNYSSERYIINFDKKTNFKNKKFQIIYEALSNTLTSKNIFETATSKLDNVVKNRIKKLKKYNFKFNEAQVEESRRKEGPHKGYAEYLFYR